jgi:ATP-dependent exoDNAse (exonuclease V) beta subunit
VFAPLDRIRVKTGSKLAGTPFEHLQHEEQALKQLDMFNELYVAFTRPKYRLYACGLISQSGKTSSAIQHVFKCLAAKYPSVGETHQYQLGERSKYKEERKQQETLNLASTGDPNWMSRISIARPSKDKWKTKDESDARNMGILIHEAMARITTSKDIQKAVTMLLQDGRISNSEADEMKLKINHLLEQKELQALYSDSFSVRNEAAIQLEGGSWLRPDRVAFKDDEAWVLDYKTGKEETKHLKQIDQYKEAMRQLGFKHVHGILVYLNEERFVTV